MMHIALTQVTTAHARMMIEMKARMASVKKILERVERASQAQATKAMTGKKVKGQPIDGKGK